ncbi:uncharacterized protein [Diadema antillarum]|uniref:uncharacterized protein n=1 Tax=Diadema antillarum TaxID=105358 RepID=UPI003A87132F
MSLSTLIHSIALNEYFTQSFAFYQVVTQCGMAIGAAFLPFMMERSLEAYGIRGAFLIMGGICLNTVPCGATIRSRTDYAKSRNASALPDELSSLTETNEDEITRVGAEIPLDNTPTSIWDSLLNRLTKNIFILEPVFAILSPAMGLVYFLFYAWYLFLVPRLEWIGIDPSRAVYLASLAGFAGFAGMLTLLAVMRKFGDSVLPNLVLSSLAAISLFVIQFNESFVYQAVLTFCQGFIIIPVNTTALTMTKISIVHEQNMSAALTVAFFMSGAGTLLGDTISGIVKRRPPDDF